MKYLFVILLFLSGCSVFNPNIRTEVIWHDGKTIEVSSSSDAVVVVKIGDGEITVDNRGRPGVIEQFFAALLLRAPQPQNQTQAGVIP